MDLPHGWHPCAWGECLAACPDALRVGIGVGVIGCSPQKPKVYGSVIRGARVGGI